MLTLSFSVYPFSETSAIDTYESYYLAYGLFGIFMKWARNGYAESVQMMTQIVVERIFAGIWDK